MIDQLQIAWQGMLFRRFGIQLEPDSLHVAMEKVDVVAKQLGFDDAWALYDGANKRLLSKDQWSLISHHLLNHETRFMRHEDLYAGIGEMFSKKGFPKIWCAGCSYGHEVYSIAAKLEERGLHAYDIVGTDLSEVCLTEARRGRFSSPCRSLSSISTSSSEVSINYSTKTRTRFEYHNLLKGPLEYGAFDFALSTNLMIYYTTETQSQIFENLLHSLKPGGVVVTNFYRPDSEQLTRLTPLQVGKFTGYKKD